MKGIIIKIILLVVAVGILGYGIFYLWGHRYEYFFQGEGFEVVNDVDLDEKGEVMKNKVFGTEGGAKENYMEDIKGEYIAPVVNSEDCDKECESFKEVESEYEYCREICGLNEIKEGDVLEGGEKSGDQSVNKDGDSEKKEEEKKEEDCGEIEDSFKGDVCWKEKAVKEKNAVYCENISDQKMSEVCENRVLEEIMD